MYKPLSLSLPSPKSKTSRNDRNEYHLPTFLVQREADVAHTIISEIKSGSTNARKQDMSSTPLLGTEVRTHALTKNSLLPLRQTNPAYQCALPLPQDIEKSKKATTAVIDKLLSGAATGTVVSKSQQINRLETSTNIVYETSNIIGSANTKTSHNIKIIERHHDPLAPSTRKVLKRIPMPEDNPELLETSIVHENNGGVKKITEEDKALGNIPSAISSWENAKGFSVSIDKRLQFNQTDKNTAKDINTKFVDLTSALDSKFEEKKLEIQTKQDKMIKDREEQEQLEKIKSKILESRNLEQRQKQQGRIDKNTSTKSRFNNQRPGSRFGGNNDREMIRQERRRELESNSRFDNNNRMHENRAQRSGYSSRDVQRSEPVDNAHDNGTQKEVQYDARFYTQGANAAAKRNDEQVYDTPLFQQKTESITSLYRGHINNKEKRADANEKRDYISLKKAPVEFTSEESNEVSSKTTKPGLQLMEKEAENKR